MRYFILFNYHEITKLIIAIILINLIEVSI